MPTTIDVYVDTDALGGGDGTIGNPYNSPQDAVNAKAKNLVTADEICRINITGSTDVTTQVLIKATQGWVTDETHYIELKGDIAGKVDTNKCMFTYANVFGSIKVEDALNVYISNLQFRGNTGSDRTNFYYGPGTGSSSKYATIRNCVFDGRGFTGANSLAIGLGSESRVKAYNNLFLGYLYHFRTTSNQPSTFYDNNFIGAGTAAIAKLGGSAGAVTSLKGNLFSGNVADIVGSIDANSTNNVTDSATPFGSNCLTSRTFSFLDSANGDYHLVAGDSGARFNGIDLSADSTLAVTLDVDGETRLSTPDAGYDQLILVVTSTKVDFVTQPEDTLVGQPLNDIEVASMDADGEINTSDTRDVTMSIFSAPSGVGTPALQGTLTKTLVEGKVTFSDLSIRTYGTPYKLQIADSTAALASSQSDEFEILSPAGVYYGDEPMNPIYNGSTTDRTVYITAIGPDGNPVTGLTGKLQISKNGVDDGDTLNSTTETDILGTYKLILDTIDGLDTVGNVILLKSTNPSVTRIVDGKFIVVESSPISASVSINTDENGNAISVLANGEDTALAGLIRTIDVDGIELHQALAVIMAAIAGNLSGAGTGTEILKAPDGTTTRISAALDAEGNRILTITLPS